MTNKRILIIDDSSMARRLIKSSIPKDRGYIIDLAADGDEAIEKAKENLPNIVFCDYNMPGKNGVEVCLAFKELGLETKFVLVTANLQTAVKKAAYGAGFVDTVKKPFDKKKMIDCLEEHGLC
ncbi:MAG: response regulator [Candidatus Scalindua sp.]|jgi:CheY-like chemotaxis protein|nr:response regulator [Candidatus Scalindua sp.]MBT6047287.1 response regulator [Candidatus Scalindua sp.]